MPIGVIVNVLCVVFGGIAGAFLGNKLSGEMKDNLNMVFGVSAMTMGISSIILMCNMPAVIFSTIAGTVIGTMMHLGGIFHSGGVLMQKGISKILGGASAQTPEQEQTMITALVLFCASGTGIYGSIVSGMTGDHSILLSKSILDFPTALIFACTLGAVTALIAIPQLVIFLLLFFLAGVIFPLCTPEMIGDFKACGGILLVATGFRMLKLKDFPVADMIPAMVIVMPVSWFWMQYVLPLVS